MGQSLSRALPEVDGHLIFKLEIKCRNVREHYGYSEHQKYNSYNITCGEKWLRKAQFSTG